MIVTVSSQQRHNPGNDRPRPIMMPLHPCVSIAYHHRDHALSRIAEPQKSRVSCSARNTCTEPIAEQKSRRKAAANPKPKLRLNKGTRIVRRILHIITVHVDAVSRAPRSVCCRTQDGGLACRKGPQHLHRLLQGEAGGQCQRGPRGTSLLCHLKCGRACTRRG